MSEYCVACRMPTPRIEKHHIIPVQSNGPDTAGNLIPLCVSCHDRVDRMKCEDLFYWVMQEQAKEPAPTWAMLMMLKSISVASTFRHKHLTTEDETTRDTEE